MMQHLGKNIRFLREQKGKDHSDIAILVNKSPDTIDSWEKEESEPGIRELLAISAFFEVSPDEILLNDLEKAGQDISKESQENPIGYILKQMQLMQKHIEAHKTDIEHLKKIIARR